MTGAEENSTGELRTNDAAQPVAELLTAEQFLEAPDVAAEDSGLNAYYSRDLVLECLQAAIDAAQPARAEPPLSLTLPIQAREIIDKLLELAAIVDRAVEDWGESLPDGSCIVTFHVDEAEKRDGVLDWLDALPDPDDESHIYSGPAKAAHILKALIDSATQDQPAGGAVPAASNVVPGQMRCARCKFQLTRSVLYVGSGTVGAGDSKTEPCPNGCGPLWPVTWEEAARDAWATCEQMFERAKAAEDKLATIAGPRLVSSKAAPTDVGRHAPGVECHGLDTPERVCFYEQDFYVLSNFSSFNLHVPCGFAGIPDEGLTFPTSEHAYHWHKFSITAPEVADAILSAPSAHEAFKVAERNKAMRWSRWDGFKVEIMRDLLRLKVEQHDYVRRKLLATGERELVENSWRDDFWGWGPNRDGQNMLGKLWMEIRAELRISEARAEGGAAC